MRPSRQARITRQFEQRSAWWDRIYEQTSLEARILRRRQQVALTWVEQLSRSHPAGSRVLEIGCGAGATAGVDGASELANEDRSAMQHGCVTLKPGGRSL